MKRVSQIYLVTASMLLSPAHASAPLPAPTSEGFCLAVQQIMANTSIVGNNTVFDNMPAYRASKPMVDPLNIYQIVTYRGETPIMVSCKVKGAAHLRAAFGPDAAGEQFFCPTVAGRIKEQAIAGLVEAGAVDAAASLADFVIEPNEPYITGQQYLSEFELSFIDDDGAVHINSPGLFHDYDSWTTLILPERFEGQVYCHLATVEYLQALAAGEMQPGTLIVTTDDAPTTPQETSL